MSLNNLFVEIESYGFAARLNAASGLKTFLRAASSEGSVDKLLYKMDDIENRSLVLLRMMDLVRLKPDPRYENPKDTALAVYLWVLKIKDMNLAEIGAEAILSVPQCWWAARISRHILEYREYRNKATSILHEPIKLPPHIDFNMTNHDKSAEVITLSGLAMASFFLGTINVRIITGVRNLKNRNSDSPVPVPIDIGEKYADISKENKDSEILDFAGFSR